MEKLARLERKAGRGDCAHYRTFNTSWQFPTAGTQSIVWCFGSLERMFPTDGGLDKAEVRVQNIRHLEVGE